MGTPERYDRGDWQMAAACAGDMGSVFYPPLRSERKALRVVHEKRAKAVCATCPVRAECLAHAIAHDERYGIWGGTTGRERRLGDAPITGPCTTETASTGC